MSYTFLVQAIAWLTFGFVMIATIAPANSRAGVRVAGHDGVFLSALMGFLLIAAYPDDRRIVALVCVFAIVVSEALRAIFPSRPASVEGTVVKILGAAVGLIVGGLLVQAFAQVG